VKKCFFWFVKYTGWLFFRLFYGLRVYGKNHLPEGGAVIAVNHTSYYDPPIVGVSSSKEIHFLAREGLFHNPVFGGMIRALNAHPLSGGTSDVKIFRTIFSLLSKGKKVILFPEGGRQLVDEFGPVKPGASLLVAKSETAVVPTYIDGAHAVWARSRKFPKLFGKLACVFGTPIFWKDYAHMDRKAAQAAISEEIAKSWHSLRDWVRSGCKGAPP